MTLFERVKNAPNAFEKFKTEDGYTACLYPEPFDGDGSVLVWFFCRYTRCEVFVGVSKEVAERMFEDSWADVSHEFCLFIEQEAMPHCKENTDWYASCDCEGDFDIDACDHAPFDSGDFSYGEAEEKEFVLSPKPQRND